MHSSPIEHRGRVVKTQILAAAPRDRAWGAWTDPDRLSGWFTDRVKGRAERGATFTWIFDRFRSEFPYEVVEAVPPERLILRGAPPGRPPYVLEVVLEPTEEGTLISVINSGFSVGTENDEEFEGVRSGWKMALSILKEYLEHHDDEAKTIFFAMQPAAFEYSEIQPYFREPAGLAAWLTRSGGIGEEGERYEVVLRDGALMSGRVLCSTGREVALSWDELHGVIELKAFSLGPRTRAVCVRGLGWELGEEAAQLIETSMAAAIDRLVAALTARKG